MDNSNKQMKNQEIKGNKITKFRIIYIASLVILGVLIAFTVFRPMVSAEEYSEVQRAQLLEREVSFVVYKEGESAPIEQATYFLG